MRINTNLSALNALRNLNATNEELDKSIARLSSGLRISTAADDPAGLVISERLRTQILAIDQASRNSQDAINLGKTADGAIAEINTLLVGVRQLAVHSANTAVNDAGVLSANQRQIKSIVESIDRIARNTAFGDKKLLDGSAGSEATVTLPDYVASIYMGGTFNGNAVVSGPITADITTRATRAQIATDVAYASPSSVVPEGTITINGTTIISTGSDTLQGLVTKINEVSSLTGVTAQITGLVTYSVTLVQNTYGANYSIQLVDPDRILNSSPSASAAGTNAVASVSVTTTQGVETVAFQGGRSSGDSGLHLTDSYGNAVMLTENGNLNMSGPNRIGVLTVGSIQIQFGPSANQTARLSIPGMFASGLGTGVVPGGSVATIDVTTRAGAEDAIRIADAAISRVSRVRGELGSFQKDFLEGNVRSLGVTRENITAAESQVRDADIALEMTNYTKLQILQQSGVAVLAQANQLPQSLLRLFRE